MTIVAPPLGRIVHMTSAHPCTDPRIFEKECTALANAGYEVHLVGMSPAPANPGAVHVVTRDKFGSRLRRFVFGPLWALREALPIRPDAFHMHDPELIPVAVLLKLLGKRVVFDSHEDIPETLGHRPYLPSPLRRAVATASHLLVAALNIARVDVVCATPHIARRYRRSTVVQNFPMIDDWVRVEPGALKENRLVYIGGISESRGVWQMLEATHLLRSTRAVTLTLAGPIDRDLLARVQASEHRSGVEYVGLLDRAGVRQLLASSSLGLVLFDASPNNQNGQPTKLFEYMAAGLPVVVSDFPRWRELLSDSGSGVVVDQERPRAIADAILEIWTEPGRAKAMGDSGRSFVESEFNWTTEEKSLVALYRRIVGA